MNEICSVNDFKEVVDQGVNDDPNFASYLSAYVADKVNDFDSIDDSMLEDFALCERKALNEWRKGRSGRAVELLKQFTNGENIDNSVKGLVLRLAAQIAYSDDDVETSRELQTRASGLNRSLAKPIFSSSDSDASLQAKKIAEFISYQTRKSSDVSTKFDTDLKSLSEQCHSKEFESKLELLGKYLGASSKRYDNNGDGPDVVWVFEEEHIAFAFEAKNEKLPDNPLTKQEHGQLQVAKEWLRAQYPKMKCFAISVHPNNMPYKNASAESALVLTLNKLNELVKSIGQLIAILSCGTLNERSRLAQCETLINQHNLRPEQILGTRVETFIAKEQG